MCPPELLDWPVSTRLLLAFTDWMRLGGTAISEMKMETSIAPWTLSMMGPPATVELSLVSSQCACLKLTPPFPGHLTILEGISSKFLRSRSQAAIIHNQSYFMIEREALGVNIY